MQQQSNNNERFILPGEIVNIDNAKFNTHHFYQENSQLKSLYFGFLSQQNIGGFPYLTVLKKTATYIPEKNHFVIGIIKNKAGDNFVVDINSPMDALLGGLEFDGATKRNKPNLNPGDLVFSRVSEYSKFIGAKLSCLNSGYSAKNVLNELKGGTIVYGLSGREKLVQQKLEVIKQFCQFQIAFGKNDILWLSCSDPKAEMILSNIFTQILKGCSEQLFQTLIKMLKA